MSVSATAPNVKPQFDDPDADLVVRLKSADREVKEAAFKEFVERHYRTIARFAAHKAGGDHDLKDDIVQDSLLVVWQKIDTFGGRAKFKNWVLGVTSIISKNLLSRKIRRRNSSNFENVLELQNYFDNPFENPFENFSCAETANLIERELGKPDLDTKIFKRRLFDDVSYEGPGGICEEFGLSADACRARVKRVRQRLQGLTEHGEENPSGTRGTACRQELMPSSISHVVPR